MSELTKDLGRRIQQLRKEKTDYTQEQMALHLGFGRSHYSEIERGLHNINLTTLKRLADGLGVTMSDLLKGL